MLRKYIILFIIYLFSAGCATVTNNTSHVPEIKNLREPYIASDKSYHREEGSLWSEISGISLYPDRRARKIGDIVIVRIVEDPEAKLNANTKTGRSSSISAKLKLLGYMKALAEKNPRLAQDPGNDDLINAALSSSFSGTGSSDRDGHIKAYISALVVDKLPNGNLYINGKREIKVNQETQYITLAGMIRPEDISPSNEISSTYVANAKITYSGIGVLADKQKPGWLGRVIDYVWPF